MSTISIIVSDTDQRARCSWCGTDPQYIRYHDNEWGVPQHDSRALFEKICLEGFQAGLSWITILRRRAAFRQAFYNFDPERVALMTEADVKRLANDPTIIRHRGKITATIANARATLALSQSLDEVLWAFAPQPPPKRPASWADIKTFTKESHAMSAYLKKAGFRYVGATTLHALMQATGMVDDHFIGCFRAIQGVSLRE